MGGGVRRLGAVGPTRCNFFQASETRTASYRDPEVSTGGGLPVLDRIDGVEQHHDVKQQIVPDKDQ